jgi:hypothetical protein
LRSHISVAIALALIFTAGTVARADMPSVVTLDARSRAEGNRLDVSTRVGDQIFSTPWPAQVLRVEANGLPGHVVVGLMISGVKFHGPLTRQTFLREVGELVRRSFTASPEIEEIDVWAAVPISVHKGAVVSGDLAQPTSRNVFAMTVPRGLDQAQLLARMTDPQNAFWDQDWERTAFKEEP